MLGEGLMQIRKELDPLIGQIGSEKGFDLILRYDPDSNMLYYNDKNDITNEIIKRKDEMVK
jgi:Skp family chaperone for outer membrane proteins